jgi:hypothetical protein
MKYVIVLLAVIVIAVDLVAGRFLYGKAPLLENRSDTAENREITSTEQKVLSEQTSEISPALKLKKLKHEYLEKKNAYKDKLSVYHNLKKELFFLSKKGLENVKLDKRKAQKALALIREIKSLKERIEKVEDKIRKSRNSARRATTKLRTSRSKSQRIGWRYISDPLETVRPISSLSSRNKKKRIRYIYGEDTRGEDEAKKYKAEARELEKKKEFLRQQHLIVIKKYKDLRNEYGKFLIEKAKMVKNEMAELKSEGKKIYARIRKINGGGHETLDKDMEESGEE